MLAIRGKVKGIYKNKFVIEGRYKFNGGESSPLKFVFDKTPEDEKLLENCYQVLNSMMECEGEVEYSLIDDFSLYFGQGARFQWPHYDGVPAKVVGISTYFYDDSSDKYRVDVLVGHINDEGEFNPLAESHTQFSQLVRHTFTLPSEISSPIDRLMYRAGQGRPISFGEIDHPTATPFNITSDECITERNVNE